MNSWNLALSKVLCLTLTLVLAGSLGAVPIGTAFTYQGVLKDGGLPANGSFNFVFRLFDEAMAGAPIGSDVTLNGVTVADGLFTVELDFGAVFDGTELWLEIEVGGTILGSRQNLTPTPYALYSASSSLVQTAEDPTLAGSLGIGGIPISVDVAGRYVYVVDRDTDDLKIIDVSDPSAPELVGSEGIGGFVTGARVAGRYAYVVDLGSDDLRVFDVSDASAPVQVGSVGVGSNPNALAVSGRYVYVVDSEDNDLRIFDVSAPSTPFQVGSVGLGEYPISIQVVGPYAYIVDRDADDFKVIDVSDPSLPTQVGVVPIGGFPVSVDVSGRYAYVVDLGADDLKVIDVSDPAMPTVTGTVPIGSTPRGVTVSGRYAYVADAGSDDLKVIDVSDPTTPVVAASLAIFGDHRAVTVSGRYAYVVSETAATLSVVDVSGGEVTSMIAHSLEAGNLQVRDDMDVQGQLSVASGVHVGAGGLYSDGDIGVTGTLAIANDIAPTSSPLDLVQLYAEDNAGSAELKVRDEAGNVTTLSPHNFSLIGEPSEPLAWSFYSENDQGAVNVDMMRALRLLEQISGEKLLHLSPESPLVEGPAESLVQRIEELERQLAHLKNACGLEVSATDGSR